MRPSLVTSSVPWAIAQLSLALVIFWPFNPWIHTWAGLLPGYTLIATGAALMVWTLTHNRRGNWQVAPAVRTGAHLVTSGPYRWVRHPMYVSLLLVTLGFVVLDRHAADLVAWLLLAGVFAVKSRLEESTLVRTFPDYAAYRQRTGAFWPRRRPRR